MKILFHPAREEVMRNSNYKLQNLKCCVRALVFALVVLAVSVAHAALTKQLSYQGRLLDASGVPVPNGTYTVVFSIYNVSTGGSPLWTETQNVAVDKGGFAVYLGSVTPLTVLFNEDYFLGIKVGSDPEMTPRLKLAVVGTSAFALDAGQLGGQPPSNYALTGHTHSFGSLTGAVAVSPSTNQVVQGTSGSVTPLGIKGQTGQSVPYFTVEDNAGGRLFAIMQDGHVIIPSPNVLHIAKMDNDSPGGPMGNITVDVINNTSPSQFRIVNSDASFNAELFVESDIQLGGNFIRKTTPGTLNVKSPGAININASDAAAPTSVNILNDDATQVANLTVEGVVDIAGTGIKHNAPGTFNFSLNDAGNTILNITNPGTGTASLQVEGATVVTSVNGVVANPSATQTITAQNAATTALSIKSAASPTAPIFEVLDDASVRKFAVMSDGHVFIPGSNQLHVLNMNNDSPTGPMGNMNIDVMNSTGNSKLVLQNSDASFQTVLDVEGAVLVGGPVFLTARVSAEEKGTTNYAGYFRVNNAGNSNAAVLGSTNGTGVAVAGTTTGTNAAGYFEVNNASNAGAALTSTTNGTGPAFAANATGNGVAIFGESTGAGALLVLKQGGVNKFIVGNTGNITFGSATPSIFASGAGANLTIDANDAAASTVTITNTGTGVAKLSVEGAITAFNGSNGVPVTGGAAQQLIQSGSLGSISCPTGATINFPTAYSGVPIVVIVPYGGASSLNFSVGSTTSTNFNVSCNPGGTININWIAIGDK